MENSFGSQHDGSGNIERKVYKAGVVDVSKLAEAQARDVADHRMTESKEERAKGFKNWIIKTSKRIWKHNLAQEWYRQREIGRVRKEISESGNLYAGESEEASIQKYEEAKKAIVERFTSEYEDEMLKTEEKASKKEITDDETKNNIKDLIKQFAGDQTMSEDAFREQQKRILSKSNPEYTEKGKMYADNLLDIAREIRNSVTHGEKLNEMDFDVEITLGQARESLNTEAKHNSFEKIIEKTQNSKLGKYLFNEPAAIAIAAGLYSAVNFLVLKGVRSKAVKWGTFGAGAVLAGGISAMKEAARLNRERAQHMRERAKGMEFTEDDMKRREKMEENRYETKNASEIIKNLESDLAKISTGKVKESELDAVLVNLSDLEARIKLGDQQKIDLVAYSRFSEVEKERMTLDLYRAKIKVAIRKGIADGRIEFTKGDFNNHLNGLIDVQSQGDLSKDIEQKNKIFKSMKRKKVVGAFFKTALISGAIGFAFQEIQAAFQSGNDGVIEGAWKSIFGHDEEMPPKATALEALRRWMTDYSPRLPFGVGHEMIMGGTHMQLPDGVTMTPYPDGTYDIFRDNELITSHFKPEFVTSGSNIGDLTEASKELLAKDDILTSFSQTGGKIAETVVRSGEEYTNEHPELTTKIHREMWMDNDTPMHPDASGKLVGADLNELKLEWGGSNGLDANGNYVFTAQHMADDGSYHNGLSVEAQEQMKKGGLYVLLSITKGLQHEVFKVPLDISGNAIIDPHSPIGEMMFDIKDGHAVFNGQFAEIAHATGMAEDGGENMKILATHIGSGRPGEITEEIIKDTTVPNVKLDVPADWDYEVPPVIPIPYRRPLERGKYGEVPDFTYYMNGYGGATSKEELEMFEKMKSETLKENPTAKLDNYKEIKNYLEKQDSKHLERIKKLAHQIEKMDPECKASICIPVAGHQEEKSIYESLQNYSYQIAKPKEYEIVLFVNHPEKDKTKKNLLNADKTLKEIERFKKDYPNMKVRVMYEVLSNEEANIGKIRKLLVDSTLVRQQERGKDAPDLIIISNDADNKGVSPDYVQSFIDQFEKNPKVDGMLGQLDWDPESYQKYPAIHIGTRLFQFLNVIGRHRSGGMVSSGANSAFRSSIYAGIGGYVETRAGEDISIRKAIIAARGENDYFTFAGTGTRLFTSSRRSIDAWKSGVPPVIQWSKGEGFTVFDEIRRVAMEGGKNINYEDKEIQKQLKKEIEAVVNLTLDEYEKGEKTGKDNAFYKKALGWLGIKYTLNEKGNVVIDNFDSLINNLKKYQEEGKLIRDARSGKSEAIKKLKSIREKDKKLPAGLADVLTDIGLEQSGSTRKTPEGKTTPLKFTNIFSMSELREKLKEAEKSGKEKEVLAIEKRIRELEKRENSKKETMNESEFKKEIRDAFVEIIKEKDQAILEQFNIKLENGKIVGHAELKARNSAGGSPVIDIELSSMGNELVFKDKPKIKANILAKGEINKAVKGIPSKIIETLEKKYGKKINSIKIEKSKLVLNFKE